MKILLYDGSFEGLLTSIFEVFEYKFKNAEIVAEQNFSTEILFAEQHQVFKNAEKSARVLAKIEQISGKETISILLRIFLSEHPHKERLILKSIKDILQNAGVNVFQNLADPDMLEISKILKSMRREIHRMHAFVRFERLKDNLYFAKIEPDFDVLPLIGNHFEKRYADQKWMIFDLKRHYGLIYDLENVDFFYPESAQVKNLKNPEQFHHEEEKHFQKMWQNYFVKTGIPSRKNMKLHIQHVPKRYWKYLTEKQR
ncbi:TIGR03915 family putative DNA repair protein [Chryseobacterium taklimakanense]|uniref:DNA metabolism protein n=1 Tax=Chryseobacterium taklimakanense TaxID=536441 RepID=A0A3G8WN77_9FLAO|nr:TIGR03915 family putative DNA repair protein [Chryseobacterium taklimakanense]AZI20927.1 DNA metabolism protein [Chryseobacterium taklimakanense]